MESERKSRYELFLEEEARKAQPPKKCPKCGEVKALGEFHKNKRNTSGVSDWCKKCNNGNRIYKDREDRFWKLYHSRTVRAGECIEWTGNAIGARNEKRTPVVTWNKRLVAVRRIVYGLAISPITNQDVILMKCNNSMCVRHSHLLLGTKDDREIKRQNRAATADRNGARTHPERLSRGDNHYARRCPEKLARGSMSGRAKLAEEDVRIIKALSGHNVSARSIGARFGVSEDTIRLIWKNKTWSHVQ